MPGIEKLRTGDFNCYGSETLDDGSRIVELSKRGEGKYYVFQVWDLYGPEEEVLVEEIHSV